MSLLRRLRDRGRRDEAVHAGLAPHVDPELESRLPGAVLGQELDLVSTGPDALDADAQWWFRGIADALGVPADRLTLALATRADDPRSIQAVRVEGCTPRKLQWMLDQEAWTDRALASGDEMVALGGLHVRRGIAGTRSYVSGPDGAPVPEPGEVIAPTRVFYQLLRGDSWFNVYAAEDLAWGEAAVRAISGGALPARAVSVDLPAGWVGGQLEGPANPALAALIEERLADADPGAREAWGGVMEMLRPERFARPFASGTRYVAFDLGTGSPPPAPIKLEIWEYLAPHRSLDDELRVEVEEAGAAQVLAAGPVEHPLGPAVTLTARLDDEAVPVLLQLWLIRPGPVAYRILYVAVGDASEAKLGELAAIVRSLAVTA